VVVVVRVKDQHASTSLISTPALSDAKSDFRNTHFLTISRLLYLDRKRLKTHFRIWNHIINWPTFRNVMTLFLSSYLPVGPFSGSPFLNASWHTIYWTNLKFDFSTKILFSTYFTNGHFWCSLKVKFLRGLFRAISRHIIYWEKAPSEGKMNLESDLRTEFFPRQNIMHTIFFLLWVLNLL
jgi:hypothetical protein